MIPRLLVELQRGPGEDVGGLADALLHDAWDARATDVHIDPATDVVRLRFRIDGILHEAGLLSHAQASRIVNQFKTMANIDPVALFFPEEARITHETEDMSLDLRVTLAPCISGVKLAIRMLDPESVATDIGELGLSDQELDSIRTWLQHLSGLFLVTGPTGSGKTTTLYALLHELKERHSHIVTIEDPPEFRIDGINQIRVDEEHELTFAEGLRVTLRMDPDFLMIGEIRDQATAKVASDAAIAGRVLLSTIHARDVVSGITTLRNRGLNDHEIATSLTAVVNQRLVRVLCPHCKQKTEPSELDRAWFDSIGHEAPSEVHEPRGCNECHGLGYLGRTGVFEVWHLEEDDLALILQHADEQEMRRHLGLKSHRSLARNAIEKVATGITSIEEVKALSGLLPGGTLKSRKPAEEEVRVNV